MSLKFTIFCLIVLFFHLSVCAQTEPNKDDETVSNDMLTLEYKAVEYLILAHKLAAYGRNTYTVEALITAIKIVANTPMQKLKTEKTTEQLDIITSEQRQKPKVENLADISIENLAKDAIKMAYGDSAVLALIDKAVKEADDLRGAVGGPKFTEDRILERSKDTFVVTFRGKEKAIIYVSGDGTTNLDLFVYDENDNLIESDEGHTDECLIKFVPAWTAKFKITIKNKGYFYNDYILKTN